MNFYAQLVEHLALAGVEFDDLRWLPSLRTRYKDSLKQTFYNWRSGRPISKQAMGMIVNDLQLPTDWLVGGSSEADPEKTRRLVTELTAGALTDVKSFRGAPPNGGFVIDPNPEDAGNPRAVTRIPVVGTAKMGDRGFCYEFEHPVGFGDGWVPGHSRDANAYAVRVTGDSMHPAIKHGSVVIVEPGGQLVPGENVLVSLKDGRKMVKELIASRADSVTVESVNGGQRMTFERDEIEFVHPITHTVAASRWVPGEPA